MTREEFVQTSQASGYARRTTANRYANENPKTEYDNNDLIAVYRMSAENHSTGRRRISRGNGNYIISKGIIHGRED